MELEATVAEVAAARAYQALHVPAMFAPFAPLVADAAGVLPGQCVLDVACGTGVLAREVAGRVADGRVTGIDPAVGMLAVARENAPQCGFRRGVAEELPFDDGFFDAVVTQFGLMFFANRRRAAVEMARVLASGGQLAVAVWADLERAPFFARLVDLFDREIGRAGGDALRLPFALGDADELLGIFDGLGFDVLAVAVERAEIRFRDLATLVQAELQGWLPLMGVQPTEAQCDAVLAAAATGLADFVDAEGRLVFELSALVLTARRRAS